MVHKGKVTGELFTKV